MTPQASQPPIETPHFVVNIPAGVQIRDPHSGELVKSGDVKPRDEFWRKRLAQEDVGEILPKAPAAKPAKS